MLCIIFLPLVLILCSTISEYILGINAARPALQFPGMPFVALIIAALVRASVGATAFSHVCIHTDNENECAMILSQLKKENLLDLSNSISSNPSNDTGSRKDEKQIMEKSIKDCMNGVQHIGIPTNDIEATIEFYEKLGFEIAFRTVNEEANEKVAFLKLYSLVIETYENGNAKLETGAIDHVAIDVKNIEEVYQLINQAGLNTTQDEIHFLPFWANGVKFFTIEGVNKEKIEFSQYL